MDYILGIDIGGTFTDCVAMEERQGGEIRIAKAPSTPPNFEKGFVDSIATVAGQLGLSPSELLAGTRGIYHGCTVGTNALVEERTAKVGLLATRGHKDSIFIMQGGARLRWQPPEYIAHVAAQEKPAPLVPKSLCEEVDERVASDGKVVVALNEATAREAIGRLADAGVEAYAVTLLWSTVNAHHEQRIRELIEEMHPGSFVSISSEVARRTGEYERMVATVVNSLVGPPMRSYLARVSELLADAGYSGPLQLMTCAGGLIGIEDASAQPVLTIGSGPVAGLIGSATLARTADSEDANIIAADMGGTTFDVGLVRRGVPSSRATATYGQYEYFVPTHDVRSVGSGGGSIIRFDGETLKVGPQSAGAVPGPACYGRGGVQPTITDANLLLGYLNPDYFLGGQLPLDVDAARRALEATGRGLCFDAEETAAAAVRIVDNQMADAIRMTTIQQGYDARDFTMYAYGGAGPVHASALARELGLDDIVVPLSNFASGWSAFGVASSDAIIVRELGVSMKSPFEPEPLSETWRRLEDEATERLVADGIERGGITLERFADMRFAMQVNELEVLAPGGEYSAESVAQLVLAFETEYERLFGVGSGYADAGITLSALRVRASAKLGRSEMTRINGTDGGVAVPKRERDVLWYGAASRERVPVYDGSALRVGVSVTGPAILEYPDTTVVMRAGDTADISDIGVRIATNRTSRRATR